MDTTRRKRIGTASICTILLVGCAVLYFQTYTFPEPMALFGSDYGSAFFPRIMLIVVAACTVVILIQSILQTSGPVTTANPEQEIASLALGRNELARVGIMWVACLLFYMLWVAVGYVIASPIFIVAIALLLGVRNVFWLVFLAATGPLLSLLFWYALRVSL